MKRKNLLFLMLFTMACMVCVISCKKDSASEPPATTTTETPLFYDGQIVDSKFYVDNVIREVMIDTVVNLGSKELPALFYVNQQHTLDGTQLAQGNSYSNVYRSLTRQDLYDFIVKWGQLYGMTINVNDPSAGAVELRHKAFFMLQSYLMENDLDLPLLISITKGSTELSCAKKWVDAARNLARSGYKVAEANSPNSIFQSLDFSGHTPAELSFAAQSHGLTEKDFLVMANRKGLSVAGLLGQGDSPQQVGIIVTLVCLGIDIFTTLTVHLIDAGKPNPDLNSYYVSYINYADTNVMDYIARKDTISKTYKCAYCTLASAEFFVETYYNAYHKTLAGQYINRSGMIVKSVVCSSMMHVDGTTTYDPASYAGTTASPISWANAVVTIHYGDCCCSKRTATLKFKISGDKGYQETSWNSGK